MKGFKRKKYFDIAFPVVHGKGMEDGTLLAHLKFQKIPVVADNLSFYSLAQNKSLTKRILNDLNIRTSNFLQVDKNYNLEEYIYTFYSTNPTPFRNFFQFIFFVLSLYLKGFFHSFSSVYLKKYANNVLDFFFR